MPESQQLSLDDIVRQAELMDENDRRAFLKRICVDDAQLTEALARLRSSSPEWWDRSIDSRAFDPNDAQQSRVGESIGPYRVIRILGEGGMGEVVLAERDDNQFRRQVAIKLVRRGALSRNVQSRLKVERQILATLDHPNIARLLDGGATADGTPYIVMEYIEGESIDAYCDHRRLSIETRLQLFRTVCAAVHSAHQNLIVHRDLKPSNILVTKDGTPKLLDFGIAKVLDDRQMLHTMAVTQVDVRVMTPEHASPEQIRGEPVTTASDIYALGVLLYELLAGRKPYRLKSSRLSEIENAICEQEPLPLNYGLADRDETIDANARTICAARSTSASRLRRELSGDLANIVMTALRKEPERRYASAEQFSADIERYLSGMPVSAAKDSWQYRARKFIRRHHVAVSFGALAFVGLLTFAIVTTIQARRIAREQARAEQVSAFLVEMFEQADPTQSRGKEMTVREVLDVGSRKIENELAEQPDTRANLLATLGSVYGDLGLYDDSEKMLREALASRLKLYGPNDPQSADAMLRLGDALMRREKFSDAEPLLTTALAINRRAFGNHSVRVAANLRSVGMLRRNQQQLDESESSLRDSLAILNEQSKPPYSELSATLNNLALVLGMKGDNAGAEALYRRSLDATQHALGKDHPAVVYSMHNLAVAIQRQGRLDEADQLFRRSLALCKQLFGDEHPETLAALANYGVFLHRKGDYDSAEKVLREVLALDRKVRGEHHSYVGYDHVNLGLLLHDLKRFTEAEAEFRAALDNYAVSVPPTHQYVGSALRSLAITLIALNKPKEAEAALTRALDIFRTSVPDSNPQILTTRGALGMALVAQRRFSEAEPLLLDNYRLLIKARGADDPTVARMRTWIADLYRESGRPDQAQKFFVSLKTADSKP